MEATGIYHEAFAYYLFDKNEPLSIVLPNKISSYARTVDIKTVTDKPHHRPLHDLAWNVSWSNGSRHTQYSGS